MLAYAGEEVKKSIASPRLGTADDIGNIAAFLCSEQASFINGEVISVNGGFMMGV